MNAARDDAPEWNRRIFHLFDVIEGWAALTKQLQLPTPTSDLAEDDLGYPLHPASSVAWYGIGSSIDHLGLVRDALVAKPSLRPFAYYTPLRSALLSASRTVWVLHPDDSSERQRRSLLTVDENNRRMLQLVTETGDGPFLAEGTSESYSRTVAMLNTRAASIAEAGTKLGIKMAGKGRIRVAETTVIREAAGAVHGTEGGADHATILLWMTGSGHAHGLSWQSMFNVEIQAPDANGNREGRARTTTADFGQALGAAVLMCDAALKLYQARSGLDGKSADCSVV